MWHRSYRSTKLARGLLAGLFVAPLFPVGASAAGGSDPTPARSATASYIAVPDLHGIRDDIWPDPLCGKKVHEFGLGCAIFQTERDERWIAVDVVDATGQEVAVNVLHDFGGIPGNDGVAGGEHFRFCGSTTKPIMIKGGTPVRVHVVIGTCEFLDAIEESVVATTGTITVDFFKQRPPKRPVR